MAKNAQAEMVMIGLQDEGGMVDEESGNEVPNGALKEEVRDDQPAMLSPGEFVIPAYAVRYIGVERLVGILREAKQGMEQLDDIGLTGEPNSDDAGLETAVLPSEMQAEGGMPMLAEGGVAGNVFRKPLPTQAKQTTFPTPAAAAVAPSPVVQAASASPVRPQTNISYPQYVYSPEGGAGGGYGVEEYVGPDGQSIYVTTIGGKPLSKIPEDFVTRAKYTKQNKEKKDVPPTALKRKKEFFVDPGTIEAPEDTSDPFGITAAANFASLAAWAMGKGTMPTSLIGIVGAISKNFARAYVINKSGKYFGKSKEEVAKLTEEEIQALVDRTVKYKVYVADKVKSGELTSRSNVPDNSEANAKVGAQAIDQAIEDAEGNEAAPAVTEVSSAVAGQQGITIDRGNQGPGTPGGAQGVTPTPAGADAEAAAEAAAIATATEGFNFNFSGPSAGAIGSTGQTSTNAAALGGIGAAAAAAAAQEQSITANALGSRSTAQNLDVTADTSLGGRPDSINAGGVSASADPTNPGASAGPPGMTAEDVAPPQSSTLLSRPGDVVDPPSFNDPSVPSFEAPSVPGDDGVGYGGAPSGSGGFGGFDTTVNKGGLISMANGGMITVGDKTYKPEDFGFANKGAFVTKKKTRKRKKGKGLASSK